MKYIKFFTDLSLKDVSLVGGKNASLGEMIHQVGAAEGRFKIKVPLGFAVTVTGYWAHLEENNLIPLMEKIVGILEFDGSIANIRHVGKEIRELISQAPLPSELVYGVKDAYQQLSMQYHQSALDVAVRSSATAEDLPHASFAGQQETFLNIKGDDALLHAIKQCMASLFTDRSIVYRIEQGFDLLKIGLSVGVQKMVRSDKASSGVAFSLDTDTGFKDVIVITSAYGLGENIVKGVVNPDEFHVHKPTLLQGYKPIIKKQLGSKELRLSYTGDRNELLKNEPVSKEEQMRFSLNDAEILELAQQTALIENYYSKLQGSWCPMDIEWAKDGFDNEIYIVQARPETIHSQKKMRDVLIRYALKSSAEEKKLIVTGLSVGQKIASGSACVLQNISEHATFDEGDILVTSMTDPDWVPLMKKASAIITDKGGRTCHAAIVCRELGIPAIIGTGYATKLIYDGRPITVDCSEGYVGSVYDGILEYDIIKTELTSLPKPRVPILLNIANPGTAYKLSFLPVSGVGLARVEFIITDSIKVHPMAVCSPEKIKDPLTRRAIEELAFPYNDGKTFFIDTLAQGIGTIAAAFYPREVIVRFSDFKSNEYRNLLAGDYFEPVEENPMLGFRGAVRYCHPEYAPAFALECAAFKKARNEMGFSNITLLVPFVRNLHEASCTLDSFKEHGIERNKDGLRITMMCEIPSNVILLEEFSKYFDGFSIGSNDLTQFTLAVDRDSTYLSSQFNEQDPAIRKLFKIILEEGARLSVPISICGQAPSDFPEIAEFLISHGISALSLNADSVIPFLLNERKILS